MGLLQNLFGGGLKTPSDGGADANLFNHMGEMMERITGSQAGGNANTTKYTYDPNAQQYTAMKKGGTASSRADGIAQKGKTKGRFV